MILATSSSQGTVAIMEVDISKNFDGDVFLPRRAAREKKPVKKKGQGLGCWRASKTNQKRE